MEPEVVHADFEAIPVVMTLDNLNVDMEPVGEDIFNPDVVLAANLRDVSDCI